MDLIIGLRILVHRNRVQLISYSFIVIDCNTSKVFNVINYWFIVIGWNFIIEAGSKEFTCYIYCKCNYLRACSEWIDYIWLYMTWSLRRDCIKMYCMHNLMTLIPAWICEGVCASLFVSFNHIITHKRYANAVF